MRESKETLSLRIRNLGWNPDARSQYLTLSKSILEKEREICALHGSEYASESEVLPEKAALISSHCLTISTDSSCGLACGTEDFGWCVIFSHHRGIRLEAINDEVYEGHPLFQKGLDVRSSHLIENSEWIKSIKATHSVHTQYSESHWNNMKHYLLFFKDRIFEVLSSVDPVTYEFDSFDEGTRFLRAHMKI